MQSDFRKYLGQLQAARSDQVAPGISGELGRLARLAANSQGPKERAEVVRVLRAKAAELGVEISEKLIESVGPAK